MNVYQYNKSLLDRLEECKTVLTWKNQKISSSQVRMEWSYFLELQMEPIGWNAVWRVPRVLCEELKLSFPTVVFGSVEQVLFKELKAIFVIKAVQDEDVHLAEEHEVALEDLWVTYNQENTDLNIERTADCIDRLRFFYTHIWMPWDNDEDEDLNWVVKHLDTRVRFYFDLRSCNMKRALASYIRNLLLEGRYIQQRKQYLEYDINDDDEDDLSKGQNTAQFTDLMRLHLRLCMIRSELEILENPQMREIYEGVKFDKDNIFKRDSTINEDNIKSVNAFMVSLPCTIEQQQSMLEILKEKIVKDCCFKMCQSLQDALNMCNTSDIIFLSSGKHTIKFLENFNNNGKICGLTEPIITSNIMPNELQDTIIMSQNHDSVLMIFDGDYVLENLVLDCSNIRRGILVKAGKLVLKNCYLSGLEKSCTQQGIFCCGDSILVLENCLISNFATGLVLNDRAALIAKNVNIKNCSIGINITANTTKATFEDSNIISSKKFGIYNNSIIIENVDKKHIILDKLEDIISYSTEPSPWNGECAFEDCKFNIGLENTRKCFLTIESTNNIYEYNDTYYQT